MMLGSKYVGPMPYLPRSSEKPTERNFRQPKRLFSDSDVSSIDSTFCWNSKLVLKRRLQTSRVTARTSTMPAWCDATGTIATTLDSSGGEIDLPVASTTLGGVWRLRML